MIGTGLDMQELFGMDIEEGNEQKEGIGMD